MTNETLVQSKIAAEMVALSNEYCLFIERIQQYPQEDLLSFLQKILTALYLKGSVLPLIEVEDNAALERFVTEEEYETMVLKLSEIFEDHNYFFTLEFCQDADSCITLNFAEILTDIYTDLKDFLLLFAKPQISARENALVELKCRFESDWGYRIALALPYLHQQLFTVVGSSAEFSEDFQA